MGILNKLIRIGVLSAITALSGCNDLSRSEVERILNNEARGTACVSSLDFTDGGFERAKASGVSFSAQGGLLSSALKVADTPDGDQWQVGCMLGLCGGVGRKNKPNLCLPGQIEVLTIADAPFAPNNGSYKTVDYVEVVKLPAEITHLAPYVYTRYKKSAVFQKTDRGWRVAQ
jgi:hypothetical protein